jgi:DNA-binding CsgD family transcriptional regulator
MTAPPFLPWCGGCRHPAQRHDTAGCQRPSCHCRLTPAELATGDITICTCPQPDPGQEGPPITRQMRAILPYVAAGLTNAHIGRVLYISEDSVKTHLRHLYIRWHINSRSHAVALGYEYGVLKPGHGTGGI